MTLLIKYHQTAAAKQDGSLHCLGAIKGRDAFPRVNLETEGTQEFLSVKPCGEGCGVGTDYSAA